MAHYSPSSLALSLEQFGTVWGHQVQNTRETNRRFGGITEQKKLGDEKW
jgi:hypothetical protein